jgi:hypothetical protein
MFLEMLISRLFLVQRREQTPMRGILEHPSIISIHKYSLERLDRLPVSVEHEVKVSYQTFGVPN